MGVPSILFFLGSLATACAAIVPPDEVASRSLSSTQTGKHFGKLGGRNLELDTAQAIYVTLFVIAVGIYTMWLIE